MASRPRQPRVRVDDDGVRTLESSGTRRLVWLIAVAVGVPVVATVAAIVLIRHAPARTPVTVAAPPAVSVPMPREAAPEGAPAAAPADAEPRLRTVAGPNVPRERLVPHRIDQPKTMPTPIDRGGEDIDARDAIPALIAAGEQGGITVFPLPGTKPIKRGIIVPDDFVLPEGYVRHYQTTDDGQQVPPILMFHPDYDFVDSHGQPIAVPPDRVVRPEQAPPGLAIQLLDGPDAPHASGAP